jgi:hypothetical protein
MVLRDSMPYTVQHVFLIHRETGLLLVHLTPEDIPSEHDPELISAMLTAIRQFAHDAFGAGEDELDEIQYGSSRILIKSGSLAYAAVVVSGIEPQGYTGLLRGVTAEINIQHEGALKAFAASGEMDALPDFAPMLSDLFNPSPEALSRADAAPELTRGQRVFVTLGLVGLLFLIVLAVFACNFATRLIPVAYPPLTQTATLTSIPTFTPTHTATHTPTFTSSPTPTFTPTFTLTASATPTFTPSSTLTPTVTPVSVRGVMTGNVWVRTRPDPDAVHFELTVLINTPVDILAVYGEWAEIKWLSEFGIQQGWVPLRWVGTTDPIPEQIITPVGAP